MKRLTTILCCISFAIFGIGLAIGSNEQPNMPTGMTASAATQLNVGNIPSLDFSNAIPITSQNSEIDNSVAESVMPKTDTVVVTKTKWKKAPEPDPIVIQMPADTVYVPVPVYYLATQVGNKESPTGYSGTIYEVHEVSSFDSEITNSSVCNHTQVSNQGVELNEK